MWTMESVTFCDYTLLTLEQPDQKVYSLAICFRANGERDLIPSLRISSAVLRTSASLRSTHCGVRSRRDPSSILRHPAPSCTILHHPQASFRICTCPWAPEANLALRSPGQQ